MKSLQLYGRNDMVNLYKQNKVYGSLGVEEPVKTIDKVVTGEQYVVLTECVEDKLKDITLFGKSEQLQTTGKQMFDKDSSVDGVLEIDGSIVTIAGYSTSEYIAVEPNTKYTSTATGSKRLKFFDINKQPVQKNNFQDAIIETGGTFTTSDTTKYVRFSYINSAESSIMFNLGSNSSPYEPYTGRQPSPNLDYPQEIKNVGKYNELTRKYDVDVKIIGKNLFNLTNNFILGYFNATPNSKIIGYIDNAIVYIPCNPNTTYTVSGCKRKPTNTYRRYKVGETYEFPEVNTEVFNVKEVKLEEHIAFTTSSRAKYLIISAVGDSEVNIEDPMEEVLKRNVSEMMVEISDTPTKYEQYKEQTVKLSLDQPLRRFNNVYDSVLNNEIKRRIKTKTLNGSEHWIKRNSQHEINSVHFYSVIDDCAKVPNGGIFSDKLVNIGINDDRQGFKIYNGNVFLMLPKEQFPDVETLKTWLSKNPVTLEYELTEPIIEPLPEDFKQAIESLKTYYPTTVITVDGGEVKAGISVTYKSYGNNIRSETNV